VKASEDLGNHRGINDGGDDLQAAAAVQAVFNVDLEYAFKQAPNSCPPALSNARRDSFWPRPPMADISVSACFRKSATGR
jgi:hypothetical protein